jgi:nucleotide-binding universal stress UspA family protein
MPRILVSVDFSDLSRAALAWALAYRPGEPNELHLVHVVEDSLIDVFSTRASRDLSDEMALLAREAEAELLGLAAEAREGLTVHRHVLRGKPAARVVELATELGVDLLVLGSAGRQGLERALLGSVAERIVRSSPCTVVCVRDRLPV